jgi:hypothetical protein
LLRTKPVSDFPFTENATYHIQLSTDSAFGAVILEDSVLADTAYELNDLTFSTEYFWRVRVTTVGGESPWSTLWRFTTLQIPPQVVLLSPANGSAAIGDSTEFRWRNAQPMIDLYWFEYSTDPSFTSSTIDSTLTDSTVVVDNLDHDRTYYWRTRAHNAAGWGPYSAVWSLLALTSAPSAPSLISPVDRALNQPTTLTLSWSNVGSTLRGDSGGEIARQAGGQYEKRSTGTLISTLEPILLGGSHNSIEEDSLRYHIQLSTDASFANLLVNDSLLVDTTRQIGPLENRVLYYWRVRGSNLVGIGDWSDVWSFTTIVPSPSQVVLESPLDGAMVGTDSVTFAWRSSRPQVDSYWFEYSADSLFASSATDSTLADTTTSLSGLQNAGRYWWRVRAHNNAGWGPFSETRRFTTPLTSVESGKEIPIEFSLSQNYPNPFNPSTVIRYGLSTRSHVLLEIFNVLGERIGVIVNAEEEAGFHSVVFERRGLSSGIYFYRLHARPIGTGLRGGKQEDFVEIRKLTLLR